MDIGTSLAAYALRVSGIASHSTSFQVQILFIPFFDRNPKIADMHHTIDSSVLWLTALNVDFVLRLDSGYVNGELVVWMTVQIIPELPILKNNIQTALKVVSNRVPYPIPIRIPYRRFSVWMILLPRVHNPHIHTHKLRQRDTFFVDFSSARKWKTFPATLHFFRASSRRLFFFYWFFVPVQ